MQKNDQSLKRKILFDGEEVPGLVECSDIKDEEGTIEVPGFNRKVSIKDGVKSFAPVDATYKCQKDSITEKFFSDYYYLNQVKDVDIIDTDATGVEVSRYLLRDCENSLFDKRSYNAGGVEYYGIRIRLNCTSDPIRIEE